MTMHLQAMTRASRLMLLGLVAGFAAASCVRETSFVNPDHCANQTGNDWCAERYGGEDPPRPYCILGNGLCGTTPGQDGCVTGEPSDSECYSPCGDSQSASENSACRRHRGRRGVGSMMRPRGWTGAHREARDRLVAAGM